MGHALARDRRLIHRGLAGAHNAVDKDLLTGTNEYHVTWADLVKRERDVAAIAPNEGALRHAANERLDRRASAIGIQLRDELGDEDDRHQHGTSDVLPAEHGDDRRDRDEHFRADLVLVHEVEQASLDERVPADGNGPEQDGKWHDAEPVEQDDDTDTDDASHLDPPGARHERAAPGQGTGEDAVDERAAEAG